jgi:hypothetical protein
MVKCSPTQVLKAAGTPELDPRTTTNRPGSLTRSLRFSMPGHGTVFDLGGPLLIMTSGV